MGKSNQTSRFFSRSAQIGLGGTCIIIALVLLTYAPAIDLNFRIIDDYSYLRWAGTMPLPQYLTRTFDPRLQSMNYRPLRWLVIRGEYALFYSDPRLYHLFQLLLHVANSLLVYFLVARFSKRWRVALVTAIFWGVTVIPSEAIFWISDESALATLWGLLALWFWSNYLQSHALKQYAFTIMALVLALLSREASIVIPVVLFLVDRMLVRAPIDFSQLVRRYLPIALVLVPYILIELWIQVQGVFVQVGGYSFGTHVITNLLTYLSMLALPITFPSTFWGIQTLLIILFIGLILWTRNLKIIFLLFATLLAIGLVLLSPQGAYPRYLYAAMIPTAILWASGVDWILSHWRSPWLRGTIALAFWVWLFLNGTMTTEAARQMAESSRQIRVPFRDIMREHPTVLPNTRVFLIEPPFDLATPELAGMFFLNYGNNITLGSTFGDGRVYTGGLLKTEQANLRDYTQAYVYYFDDANRPMPIQVLPQAQTVITPNLPIDFQVPIRLEGYELTSANIKIGDPFAVFLYWRATGKIDLDYTVFVHLVDAHGNIIASGDNPPRNGKEKTSQWKLDQTTPDAHVIVVPENTAESSYQLEIGLYYLPTMERLPIVDSAKNILTDTIILSHLDVHK